eukprot:1090625-Pyramimonas_sp.AAC.1
MPDDDTGYVAQNCAPASRIRLYGYGSVPITGQTLGVCLCGGLQGPSQGAISTLLYLALAVA